VGRTRLGAPARSVLDRLHLEFWHWHRNGVAHEDLIRRFDGGYLCQFRSLGLAAVCGAGFAWHRIFSYISYVFAAASALISGPMPLRVPLPNRTLAGAQSSIVVQILQLAASQLYVTALRHNYGRPSNCSSSRSAAESGSTHIRPGAIEPYQEILRPVAAAIVFATICRR